MKKLMISAVLALAATGVAHAAGDATAGQAKAAVCGACHGADGNSMAPDFPKLAGQGERYLLKQMGDIKAGARKVLPMTGMLDNLTDQDMADIAAYFSQQTTSGGAADKTLVAQGERIYRNGIKDKGVPACTACHSPTGKGNAPAGYPVVGGQHAKYVTTQLKAFRVGAERPDSPEARTNDGDLRTMRDIASRLSDLEIDAVSSYISGLH